MKIVSEKLQKFPWNLHNIILYNSEKGFLTTQEKIFFWGDV